MPCEIAKRSKRVLKEHYNLKVLEAVAEKADIAYQLRHYDFGGERYLKTGEILPDAGIDELKQLDAIYLGAIGHPQVKPGILEKGILLKLRFSLDLYINLRPLKLYPGVDTPLKDKGPQHIDFDVVRENTEGLYVGSGGFFKKTLRMRLPSRNQSTRAREWSAASVMRSTTAVKRTAKTN